MKKSTPAASPDAYVGALDGWRRTLVEELRAAVRDAADLEEVIKWGHLVYLSNGPVLLIRAEESRVLFGFWRGQRLRAIEFIQIVQNVGGVGDHLAFNPADPPVNGDRPMYYCAHDPFGYAQVADSFDTWARECAAAARKGEEDFYAQFDEAVDAKWREYEASKPRKDKAWWQFWR